MATNRYLCEKETCLSRSQVGRAGLNRQKNPPQENIINIMRNAVLVLAWVLAGALSSASAQSGKWVSVDVPGDSYSYYINTDVESKGGGVYDVYMRCTYPDASARAYEKKQWGLASTPWSKVSYISFDEDKYGYNNGPSYRICWMSFYDAQNNEIETKYGSYSLDPVSSAGDVVQAVYSQYKRYKSGTGTAAKKSVSKKSAAKKSGKSKKKKSSRK